MTNSKRFCLFICLLFTATSICGCAAKNTSYSSDVLYSKLIGDVFESEDSVKVFLSAGKDETVLNFNAGFYTDSLCFPDAESVEVLGPATVEKDSERDYSACFCITDNKMVYGSGIYDRVYPASITKLMTALLTLENCDLDEQVTITDNGTDAMPAGSKNCGFANGDTLTVETLLYSLLIYSGNDAAYILSCHIAGDEASFVDMMNERAKKLFAVDTHFVNSHGLHKLDHYTTPYDVYLIFNECLKHDKFREIVSTRDYVASVVDKDGVKKVFDFEQTNLFFTGAKSVPEGITIIGGKTGTTSAAGYCLILMFVGPDGKEYICESFANYNAEDLYGRLTELMNMCR